MIKKREHDETVKGNKNPWDKLWLQRKEILWEAATQSCKSTQILKTQKTSARPESLWMCLSSGSRVLIEEICWQSLPAGLETGSKVHILARFLCVGLALHNDTIIETEVHCCIHQFWLGMARRTRGRYSLCQDTRSYSENLKNIQGRWRTSLFSPKLTLNQFSLFQRSDCSVGAAVFGF